MFYLNQLEEEAIFDESELTDEELDELYRPKKQNSRKSLAPLFVYLILQEQTNDRVHMSQNDILAALRKDPYELVMERKALSRLLHCMTDAGMGVVSRPRQGVWYTTNPKYMSNWYLEDYAEAQSSDFYAA